MMKTVSSELPRVWNQPVAPPGPSVVADVLYPNVTYDHGPVPQPK